MSTADGTDSTFTRASDLPARDPAYRVKETTVEYADGTSALTIYAGTSDAESRFATSAWVSALGDSFCSLENCR